MVYHTLLWLNLYACTFHDADLNGEQTAIDCVFRERMGNCSNIALCMQDAANFMSQSNYLSPSLPPPSPLPSPPPVTFTTRTSREKYVCANPTYRIYNETFEETKHSIENAGNPDIPRDIFIDNCRNECINDINCTSFAMFYAPLFLIPQVLETKMICLMYNLSTCPLENVSRLIVNNAISIDVPYPLTGPPLISMHDSCNAVFNTINGAYECSDISVFTKFVPSPSNPPQPPPPVSPSPQPPPPPHESNPGDFSPLPPDSSMLPPPPSPNQPAEF